MRPLTRVVASLSALALLLGACSSQPVSDTNTDTDAAPAVEEAAVDPDLGDDSDDGEADAAADDVPTSVTIRPLFVRGQGPGAEGGVGTETISLEPVTDGALRLDFSEDSVAGLGDMSRSASWSAVTVSSLLVGADLTGRYRFEVTGPIDGPSAGALKTVALLALANGHELDVDRRTMTGSINPDGTIGPVGGIPEKVEGAADEGLELVLVPVGQRNAVSSATGEQVDVIDLGRREGIEVREVADIYEAYELLTGEQLQRLARVTEPRLDGRGYDRLGANASAQLGSYRSTITDISLLAPEIVGLLEESGVLDEARRAASRAEDLAQQGLQGGAFSYAASAAAIADASLQLGRALEVLLTRGPEAFIELVERSANAETAVFALLDTLRTDRARTVGDADALLWAYANAFDALALATYASGIIEGLLDAFVAGSITLDDLLGSLFVPMLYYGLADASVGFARSIYEVGRDLGGPELSTEQDLAEIGSFFVSATEANFNAFETTVLDPLAEANGMSTSNLAGALAVVDIDIAMAIMQRALLPAVEDYIGPDELNAEYAKLGYAVANYTRNALLLTKYSTNGILDDDLQLVGVRSDAALASALDLSRVQAASGIALLLDQEVEPAIQAANLEAAGIRREGELTDKFEALRAYWGSFLSTRILAYLADAQTDGFDG
jgi:uncharacterized protein